MGYADEPENGESRHGQGEKENRVFTIGAHIITCSSDMNSLAALS
jgi:hypothetical protein